MDDYKPGDKVECAHDTDWQNQCRERDKRKAEELGKPGGKFVGNAAAYLSTFNSYIVESITDTGGLRLKGFTLTVSPKDVRPSTKPTHTEERRAKGLLL